MKSFTAALLASTLASAIELPRSEGFTAEQYESGVIHESIMEAKHVSKPISRPESIIIANSTRRHGTDNALKDKWTHRSIPH